MGISMVCWQKVIHIVPFIGSLSNMNELIRSLALVFQTGKLTW